MAIKNQAKFKKQNATEISKRFSKAKMKREMVSENANTDKTVRASETTTEPKRHVSSIVEIYKFRGEPKRVYSAIIKRHSSQQKGYDVLSAGQNVTVEDFGGDQPLRITAMDGRVGITCIDNIQLLFS